MAQRKGGKKARFDRRYRRLAAQGMADSVGSMEYRRVLAAWREAGRPEGRAWIVREINRWRPGIGLDT